MIKANCGLAAAISIVLCFTAIVAPGSAWSQGNTPLDPPVIAQSFAATSPGSATPPDTNGAVGPNHLLLATNGIVRVQDRAGNILSSITLLSFWLDLGVVDAFDPRSYYDPHSGRFMMITCGDRRSATSAMLFAVSETSDPTGNWHRWALDADASNVNWVDFGNLGFTANEITFTSNLFRNSDDAFSGVQFWRINKASALDGGSLTRETFKVTNAGGTLVPVTTLDAGVTTQYLVRTGTANLFSTGRIQLFSLGGTLGGSLLLSAPFSALGDAWSMALPDAPQLGSTARIETNDDRILSAVYRNGRVWACHNAGLPALSPSSTGAKWWSVDPLTGSTLQQGALVDVTAQRSFYYPSVVVNSQGLMMLGCSGSSPTDYVGAYYAWRDPDTAPGTLEGYQRYHTGSGPFSGPRWGDYSGIYPDPVDGTSIWALQQYAEPSNRWGIQWAKMTISQTSTSPDTDGDGLDDNDEVALGTNPLVADTDGDDLDDGDEVNRTTNPLAPDTDGDGLDDGYEVSLGTNPLTTDTDNDGIPDGTEVDAGTNPLSGASVVSSVYVNGASGSDSSGFGTQAHPWATIAHAVAAIEGRATNIVSIRVAKGTYTALSTAGGALVADSFEHLLGGYQAGSWTRNIKGNTTILDASTASNGGPAAHVVILDGIVNARLDGFTVTGAYSTQNSPQNGAGILGLDLDGTTVIANCMVTANTSGLNGSGGIRLDDASPTISNSTIAENYTDGQGGGIFVAGLSDPEIDRCTVAGNRGEGGGVFIGSGATALITNCIVTGNDAGTMGGGGMSLAGGAGTVVSNTTIAYNDANTNGGGGIEVLSGVPLFVNCIFAGNRNYAVADYTTGSALALENCLFDGNPQGDYYKYNNGAPVIRNGATSINAYLATASGNLSGPAHFTMPTGAWTAPATFSASTQRTTLTDSAAAFTPGALRGTLVALSADRTFQVLVVDNTTTSLQVRGDQSAWIQTGATYQLVDYHVELDSTAIDAGLDTSGAADGAITIDFEGTARGFDGDGMGTATGDGSDYDIGAFESDTPPILDTVTVLSPNGGEVIVRSSLQTITWSSTGNVGADVKIVARKGSSSAVIAASTPNDGLHEWLVPLSFLTGNNLKLEISSVATPTILDTSNTFFSIVSGAPLAGTVTVLSPNGGESILRGAPFDVTWSSTGNIGGAVKIFLRRGTTASNITSSTANDGHFEWIPTNPVASDYILEVSAVLAPSILDTTNTTFSLTNTPPPSGTITVTAPNGGESYLQGDLLPISWSVAGTTGSTVRIVALSAGQTFTIASSTSNDGAFNWGIPATQPPGADYAIEVNSVATPSIVDGSNAPFTIAPPSPPATITVTAPNGGESFLQGTALPIAWSSAGATGELVRIVAHGAGQFYTVATSTSDDSAFNWIIPAGLLPGTDYTIEVSSVAVPAATDLSDAAFTIAVPPPPPTITVLAPNGGESFVQGAILPISWSSTDTVEGNVQILAHGAGQTFAVSTSTSNDGAFNWTIPTTQPTGTNYTIEISSIASPAVGDSSNAAFSITPLPMADRLTVISPNGGENLVRGTTVEIAWNSTGSVGSTIKIVVRKGTYAGTLASATPNDGSFQWKIPATFATGPGVTIEISSATTPSIFDSSDTSFTIVP